MTRRARAQGAARAEPGAPEGQGLSPASATLCELRSPVSSVVDASRPPMEMRQVPFFSAKSNKLYSTHWNAQSPASSQGMRRATSSNSSIS